MNTVADGETEGRASARMGCVEFDFVTGCPELSISGLEDADFLFPLHLLSCSILLLDLHNILIIGPRRVLGMGRAVGNRK